MNVILIKPIAILNFDNKIVRFYPGELLIFKQGVAYGKGIHFDLASNEYSVVN